MDWGWGSIVHGGFRLCAIKSELFLMQLHRFQEIWQGGSQPTEKIDITRRSRHCKGHHDDVAWNKVPELSVDLRAQDRPISKGMYGVSLTWRLGKCRLVCSDGLCFEDTVICQKWQCAKVILYRPPSHPWQDWTDRSVAHYHSSASIESYIHDKNTERNENQIRDIQSMLIVSAQPKRCCITTAPNR